MAGDWIKMRCELQTHPKVVRILSATKSDKFRVIGGLHAVWGVFDAHSKDGSLIGYTPELLDHVIGWDGFSSALVDVGWLDYDGRETIALPEFDEHNSKSAKRRAEDQKRKRDERNRPESVPEDCGQNADKKRTREEKIREVNNHPLFEEFWTAYGKKVGKKAAQDQWSKLNPDDELAAEIVLKASLVASITEPKFRKDPERWLKGRHWEDEIQGQISNPQQTGWSSAIC